MTPYVIDHIPKNTPNNRRPALKMNASTITIHNTGNPTSSAAGERGNLTRVGNTRTASFHIVVDQRAAIECLPLNEAAWHAGDGDHPASGNRTSIGIEICESGDYAKTLRNAVELVAMMLLERGWGVDRLRRHFDWSGKICPRLMYGGGSWAGWVAFKRGVAIEMERIEAKIAKLEAEVEKLSSLVGSFGAIIDEVMKYEKGEQVVPAWANDAYKWATKLNPKGVSLTDGTRPASLATRVEMWTMFERFYRLHVEPWQSIRK